MKILNLYAGIGGNRKLWGDEHEITAVEKNPQIAKIYQQFFPKDRVIVADAHQYLLEHFAEYDFIWSSPPCPSHSKLGRLRVLSESKVTGSYLSKPRYPDMKLYEEIIFLQYHFKGKWCVENVIPYYDPLIPATKLQRHLFWSNFIIRDFSLPSDNIENGLRKEWEERLGFDLGNFKGVRKDTILRNCVAPKLGVHILKQSLIEPARLVDLILTDPPYNARSIGPNVRKYLVGQMQLPQEEYIEFCRQWFTQAERIAHRIVFTPGIANVCYYPQPSWIACWYKPAAVSYNRFGGFNSWEPVMLYGKMPKGKRLPNDFLHFNTLNFKKGIESEHPCPKPLAFIEKLVDTFSNEGDIVLDPFVGSGTTAVACKTLKRNYIGIDMAKEYCVMAEKRINAVSKPLF